MSGYKITKTSRFRAEEKDIDIVIKKDDDGWVVVDSEVFIPPELLRPIAEALLEMAK